MRYEGGQMNGHPSWPQFFEVMDRGFTRIHQRIDDTQESLHAKIDDVRDQVTTIKATIEANGLERRSRTARLKEWAELIAPLRELLLMSCVMAAGLAGLLQAPTVRGALDQIADRLVHQAAE